MSAKRSSSQAVPVCPPLHATSAPLPLSQGNHASLSLPLESHVPPLRGMAAAAQSVRRPCRVGQREGVFLFGFGGCPLAANLLVESYLNYWYFGMVALWPKSHRNHTCPFRGWRR